MGPINKRNMDIKKIKTLGDLKASGYKPKSIKEEIRDNLKERITGGETTYDGILGFNDTVIPDVERALLSKHNILLLGLRGQAKTRIARLTSGLLDDYIPVITGSDLNDDPLAPLSTSALDIIAEHGDKTPISWIPAAERYVEKLATPDVSIADLVGDVDPIKAATLKLPYSDPRVIHYGLIPRAHRSIFVLNELPDLQARIQVALFNILQEGDMQIRGFKLRLPLDILFIFTANPEDYTNRGSIITPLKDRIESQILTHYPQTLDIAMHITEQEAKIDPELKEKITVPGFIRNLLERIVFEARESDLIDEKSGVSARLSISALENLYSTAERRMLRNKEKSGTVRISDLWGIIPSITGKVELVYEGEQEGPYNVALLLMGTAIQKLFLEHFPHPDKTAKLGDKDMYGEVRSWFASGNEVDIMNAASEKDYKKLLDSVPSLDKILSTRNLVDDEIHLMKEFFLHGLAETEVISKKIMDRSLNFSDPLGTMLDELNN